MVARLQKTTDGYTIPLTPEMVAALRLTEGSEVEVLPADFAVGDDEDITAKEASEIYESSKAQFGRAYEALAK